MWAVVQVADMARIWLTVAVAVAQAGSYSSDSTPVWELPYAAPAAIKKKNKNKTKQKNHRMFDILIKIM